MAGLWNRLIELSELIIGQSAVDGLKKLDVSEKISWLNATLPRARLLIERSDSWGFIYKPIDELLPQLKEAVHKAQAVLHEFESQRQTLEGANWSRIPGEFLNNLRNWIRDFPGNVDSAKCMLHHVCNEMEKICSMLDLPKTPNQFNEHISKLDTTLSRAKQLIERSECWRFKHNPIKELLPQLKEAVYKAEIELDDIKSKKRMLAGADWSNQGELVNYIRNWISGLPEKVKSAPETLNYVCNEMENLCQKYKIPGNPNQFSTTARPITSSDHPKIYGRDKDLHKAINSLKVPRFGSSGTKRENKKNKSGLYIGESSSSMEQERKLAILPIVGMGGVGKTTLAQMIYNDERVKTYFDLKAWICVSDQFDLTRLTKEIFQCATNGKECNITNFNLLQEKLKEEVKSKRVLLVLDDIWSKDWQNLLGPMKEASEESTIILTTRSPEHLQCTGDNMNILKSITLEGLEEKIYWDFFKRCSGLDQVVPENYSELEIIAQQICNRLKGSPLAAKTLGGLLSKTIDKRHWNNIRDSKMWELKQDEYDIMPVLQLSYQYLPSHLKKCLSFCSMYPKDHEFTAIELTKFWIMEGFIPIKENLKCMEDLALSYFHDLKNSCFFHFKTKILRREIYVIHDLMHDVCQSVTTEECYCLEDEDFGKISHNVHHVSIFQKKLSSPREMHKFGKLHSLLVASPNCTFSAIKSWSELTSIRCLSLCNCKIKTLPRNIGNLKHLHYLDISRTEISSLPKSFWNLYNLQHLDMSDCKKFLEPSGFTSEGSNNLARLQFFRPPPYLLAKV